MTTRTKSNNETWIDNDEAPRVVVEVESVIVSVVVEEFVDGVLGVVVVGVCVTVVVVGAVVVGSIGSHETAIFSNASSIFWTLTSVCFPKVSTDRRVNSIAVSSGMLNFSNDAINYVKWFQKLW